VNVLALFGEHPRLHAEAVLACGETFHVRLPANAATGFSWQVIQQPAGLILTEDDFEETPAGDLVGGPAVQRLGFRAAHATCGRLRLSYQQSWDPTSRIRDCVIDVRTCDA